jgi:outer membrane protein assembly factor BamA
VSPSAKAKHQKVTTGIGYGSEEKARARLRWDHVNFLGGARHAGIRGPVVVTRSRCPDGLHGAVLLSPHLSLRFEGQAWQAVEPVFSQNTLGGKLYLRHQSNQQTSFSVSLINEYERSRITNEALSDLSFRNSLIALGLDPRRDITQGTVGAIGFDFNRNTTNNLLDARKGYLFNVHAEQAGRLMWGSYNYWAANGEGGSTCRSGTFRLRAEGEHRWPRATERPRREHPVLQAAVPRRGDEHSRMGTL